MALQVYNVRTRAKEPLAPLDPAGRKLGVYVCGLTVYDHAHLGHARTYVSFDVIRRWLERSYDVTHVQNVTDVEDKIIRRAKELDISPREHSAQWDQIAHDELRRLGIRDADEQPHVTTSVEDIIEFIRAIIHNGHAYTTDAGNVYFDVPGYDDAARATYPDSAYGHLSRRDYREMESGTRKDVEADKRHPADFALWKAAASDDHPDASWDSPWGLGRPGWHIECSLMSTRALGSRIDIHGGGQDLIFPHHENEIAQSQAKTGEAPFVNVWMHTGFLNVDGQKMSKSLGNFIVLGALLDELGEAGIDAAALRLYFVQTHYRSKIDFSRKGLDEAVQALKRLERTRQQLHAAARQAPGQPGVGDVALRDAADALDTAFEAAMDDDFHTPGALAAMFEFSRAGNVAREQGIGTSAALTALDVFESCGRVLSLFDQVVRYDAPDDAVEGLVREREAARAAKDWARADALRDDIRAAGWIVHDDADGTSRLEKA